MVLITTSTTTTEPGTVLRVILCLMRPIAIVAIRALALVLPAGLNAQQAGIVTVTVRTEGRPVAGATVSSDTMRTVTSRSGAAVLRLPPGGRLLRVVRLGFHPETLRVVVKAAPDSTIVAVELRQAPAELATVVIASTRNERRVADEPTRVEITDREDVEEQLGGSPGVIAELLTESGGVRVQRTSPGSSGATVRIRGMRGRYTKILSDGLPLFGITTEGLGTLQIPPIDLERVEVIKGVASALYGPTALGGVVNLVSEHPTSQPEFVLNQTMVSGSDAVLWHTKVLNPQWGYTLLAGAHAQELRDNDNDGWYEYPQFKRYVVRPRLFWSDTSGNSWFGTVGVTTENRSAGTFGPPVNAFYRSDADTRRVDAGSVGRRAVRPNMLLIVRGSTTHESRTNSYGTVSERDQRNALFGEATLTVSGGSQVLVAGAAVERDAYSAQDVPVHNYAFMAPGVFVEHTWSPAAWFGISSSARADFHNEYGTFFSPRISLLFRAPNEWSARLSAGSGVYAPTPFTEETEAIGLSRLRPIAVSAERSTGESVDVGGNLGPFELHGSVHNSEVRQPLAMIVDPANATFVKLVNASQATRTGGAELYARYRIGEMKLTGTYTYIDATELNVASGARRTVPMNPRHGAGFSAVYDEERSYNVGLEVYYNGRQTLDDQTFRSVSEPYATIDALMQRRFGRLIAFVHGENLAGVRQTDWDPVLRPTVGPGGRITTDVWAPLEGAVVNFGIRFQY